MLRMVESLKPLRQHIYTERHSVLTLPIPYINDYVYIVVGTSLSGMDVEYLRLVDADATGIYEWYLFPHGGTNKVLFGVHHTRMGTPNLLLNKIGISDFVTKYSADEISPYEPSYPMKSRHILDYYLSSASDEYATIVNENDYGRDLGKFPNHILPPSSIQTILTDFHSASDIYEEIIRWFDRVNTFRYKSTDIKKSLGIVQQLASKSTYTHSLHELYSSAYKWCVDCLSGDTTNMLYRYLNEGHLDRSELRKLSNVRDRNLHRNCASYTGEEYKQDITFEEDIPYSFVLQLVLSPVREFQMIIEPNGAVSTLNCNDLYGYSKDILDSYFRAISKRITRLYPRLKVECQKTWDNQLIMVIGNGNIGNIVLDLTSELVAGVELVHTY